MKRVLLTAYLVVVVVGIGAQFSEVRALAQQPPPPPPDPILWDPGPSFCELFPSICFWDLIGDPTTVDWEVQSTLNPF